MRHNLLIAALLLIAPVGAAGDYRATTQERGSHARECGAEVRGCAARECSAGECGCVVAASECSATVLRVARVNLDAEAPATDIERVLAAMPRQAIACNNWSAEYPYTPDAGFRMAHNGSHLFVMFDVKEDGTMALVTDDNGPVWTDSCVEFFIGPCPGGYESPGPQDMYYNFEQNCIGTALCSWRGGGAEPVFADPATMRSIRRIPSLGREPFGEHAVEGGWTLIMIYPVTALFAHRVDDWSGLDAAVNVYKCGDGLSRPHFLSWQPIVTPTPNFHAPQFFRRVRFEAR